MDLAENGAAREKSGWKAVIKTGIRVLVNEEVRAVSRYQIINQTQGRSAYPDAGEGARLRRTVLAGVYGRRGT